MEHLIQFNVSSSHASFIEWTIENEDVTQPRMEEQCEAKDEDATATIQRSMEKLDILFVFKAIEHVNWISWNWINIFF